MDLAINESAIEYSGSRYTNEQRQEAAIYYLAYGNLNKTAEVSGIPQRTLYDWCKTEWWNDLVARLREAKKDELNSQFSRLIEKSAKLIENQLDSGEVRALDAAKIMGISFDKRQILNNQPTSITKSSKISDLQAEFERYLAAKEIKTDPETK